MKCKIELKYYGFNRNKIFEGLFVAFRIKYILITFFFFYKNSSVNHKITTSSFSNLQRFSHHLCTSFTIPIIGFERR